MAFYKELLDILACPACKIPVEMTKDKKGLRCNECHRVFPIREDIPVMLLDEATVEGKKDGEAGTS